MKKHRDELLGFLKDARALLCGVALFYAAIWADCTWERRQAAAEAAQLDRQIDASRARTDCAPSQLLACVFEDVSRLSLHHVPIAEIEKRIAAAGLTGRPDSTPARVEYQTLFFSFATQELQYRRTSLGFRPSPKQLYRSDRAWLRDYLRIEEQKGSFAELQRSPASSSGSIEHWNAVIYLRVELLKIDPT